MLLIWTVSHGQFVRSARSSNGSAAVASSLEQMRLLTDESSVHVSSNQRCEIQKNTNDSLI